MSVEQGERKTNRREFLKLGLIVGGALVAGGGLTYWNEDLKKKREERECKELDEMREETNGFNMEEIGDNLRSITLDESGLGRCDEDREMIDIRQDTIGEALRQIQDEGHQIVDIEGIDKQVGWGSETRGVIIEIE